MRLIEIVLLGGEIGTVNADAFIAAIPEEDHCVLKLAGGVEIKITGTIMDAKRIFDPSKPPAEPKLKKDPSQPRQSQPTGNAAADDQKVAAVLSWAEDHGTEQGFNVGFVESLSDGIEKYGSLTLKQRGALDNIIERFHIKIEEWTA